MGTRTENDFLEWLSGASIYIGYARYGHLGGHGFVCATIVIQQRVFFINSMGQIASMGQATKKRLQGNL